MSKRYEIHLFTPEKELETEQRENLVSFLYTHLDEYGDRSKDIDKAIEYAMSSSDDKGGFALTLTDDDKIIGSVVVNRTGMSGYIPENILVYIAMNRHYRGQGLGKKLMQRAIDVAEGDIALHVEPDNPAKFLYEKLGFENKYLEMRLQQEPTDKQTPATQTRESVQPGPANVID
jgi:ribosomal-protein-alanine N-acetyltransferase